MVDSKASMCRYVCVVCVLWEVGVEGNKGHSFARCKIPFLWTVYRDKVIGSFHLRAFFFLIQEEQKFAINVQIFCRGNVKQSDPLLLNCPSLTSKEGKTNMQR